MLLRLRLENWQLYEELDLITEKPITILTGANASGKTALRDAVEFNLVGTGLLRGIKTKRDLALLSIRDEAKRTGVALTIPGTEIEFIRTMDRGADQSLVIGTRDFKVSKGDPIIQQRLGLTAERIRAALEADHALGGDDKARRTLLVAAAGAEATHEAVVIALQKTGLSNEEVDQLATLAIEDGFPDAQKNAEGKRADQTRVIRASGPEAPNPAYTPAWTQTVVDLSEITLATLRKREADLQTRVGEAEHADGVDAGRLEAARDAAKATHAQLMDEGNALLDLIESNPKLEVLIEKATEARTNAGAKERLRAGHGERARDLGAQARILEDVELEKPDPCPAIPGSPKCPMTKPKLEAHREKMQSRKASICDDLAGAEDAQRLAKIASDAAEREAREAEETRAAAQTRADRMEDLKAELDAAETAIVGAEAALTKAAEAPEEEENSSPSFYRTRLEHCRTIIEAKQSFDRQTEQAAAGATTRATAEKIRTGWDNAAKELAPDGIPTRLFADRMPRLQLFADELELARIRITPDAAFEAEVEGRWRSRAQLSESWQLRLSIVASHVLARAAGFPILIVDRFDHLDPAGRSSALQGLRRVAPHYPGGVLVLATLGKAEPTPTGLEDVETIWLHDGGAERIG